MTAGRLGSSMLPAEILHFGTVGFPYTQCDLGLDCCSQFARRLEHVQSIVQEVTHGDQSLIGSKAD
jgi:hypothetical protein